MNDEIIVCSRLYQRMYSFMCNVLSFLVVPNVLRVENLFDDDDGDDVVENTTSLISHTDGMKASEATLCYVEQHSSASPIDVMLIKKNGETLRQVAELLGFNKKRVLIFLMVYTNL
ncbi:hypothetical protein AVEN_138133-1 [Araneus ventricosus]|uniref:Uncharacterized protein n=1 Tax=Araneus ventricosus TaxID=182803 RepID=A0A4Y2F6L0_ARAVE|nr:hypothetical protein AVEN_138133-1 [Araneus ventricosus]